MSDADSTPARELRPSATPKAGVSADLDALAAYVASLSTFASSPYATATVRSRRGSRGSRGLPRANCASCHGGASFTISARRTSRTWARSSPTAVAALGGPLTGIDVPTLRESGRPRLTCTTAPRPTIAAAIGAHSG
jgi:hypothetical protein